MNLFENVKYFILFLLNKYIDTKATENLLSSFENSMIKKYIKNKIEATEIPTIAANELTNDKFVKLSDNYRRPIVIKGYMKDTDAVKKWNINYLLSIIDNFKLNVVKYDGKISIENIEFKEFVDRIEENIYINNNHTILSKFPELFQDIQPEFNNFIGTLSSTNLKNIHIANLFIGYNNENQYTGSNLHCGGSGNFFCMLHGQKHWTLIDPKYSAILKGRVAKSGIHGQTLFDMGDNGIEQVPEIFDYIPRYEVLLESGDVLWNAPWWWHRIKNDNGLSIGLAIRNNKVTKLNLLNNFTYTLSGYVYLLYNTWVIEVYEKLIGKNKNFGASIEEKGKDNVLYQIEDLLKKYPISIEMSDIN